MNVRRLPELTFVLGIVGKFQETSRLKSFSLVQSDILDDQSNTTYMNANFEETSYPFFWSNSSNSSKSVLSQPVARLFVPTPILPRAVYILHHIGVLSIAASVPHWHLCRVSTKSRVRFKTLQSSLLRPHHANRGYASAQWRHELSGSTLHSQPHIQSGIETSEFQDVSSSAA